MGIQLPPELSAVAAQAGVSWPEADEDRLRQQAAAWRDAGTKLTNLTRDADNTARTTLSAVSGDTGEAARRHWSTFVEPDTGHLTATARDCTAAADRLDHAATQVGAAKVEIVRNLVALAKNSDAAHQAAGAGHPHALLGLDTAVRATNANVTHITNTLATAVVPTNGVDVNAVQPLVNPNPGHQAPLQTVTNLATQTVSDVATPPGDTAQRGTDLAARTVSDTGHAVSGVPGDTVQRGADLAARTVSDTGHAVSGVPGDAGQRVGDLAAAGPGGSGAAQGLPGPGHPDSTGLVRIPPVDSGPGHVLDLPVEAPTPPTGIHAAPAQSVQAALASGGILDPAGPAQVQPGSTVGGPGATPAAGGGPAQGFGGAPGFAGGPAPAAGGGSPAPIPGGGSTPAPARPGVAPIGGISAPGPVGSTPGGGAGPIAGGPGSPARPGLGGIGTPDPGAPGSGGSGSGARPGAGGIGGPGGGGGPAAPGGPVAAGPGGSGRPGLGGVGVPEPGASGSGGPGSGARQGVGGAPGGGGAVPGGLADAGGPGAGADAARGRGAWSNAVPPGPGVVGQPQPGVPAMVPRERRDDGPLLFWMHMFPIGHMPVVSDRPARQLPTPPVEVDFAPGLRFPPGDHPEHGLVRGVPGERVPVGSNDGLPAGHETVAGLATGHDPLGGQHEREWDRRYLVRLGSVTAQGISSVGKEYAWPPGESYPEGGSAEGEPEILGAGTVIDRFGSPRGRVFSADETPFARRSLPPDHLAVGYRRYRVLRGLPVWRTVSAPWFGQPGGGERYRATYSAIELVALGYLEDVT